MKEFIEVPASRASLAQRKPAYGIGINDADYMTEQNINGKKVRCPYYRRWRDMLKRCYSKKFHEKYPTYKNCTVCKEWLLFSAFKDWMIQQEWEGMELDKDIKIKGNKIYSPDTCLFIPHALNSLLTDSAAIRGKYPVGVCFNKQAKKFVAHLKYNSKLKHLGYFTTQEAASQCYQAARKEKTLQIIEDNIYPQVTQFLAQHI